MQEGWCDSQGTLEAIRARLQKRQEGVLKRERAIAYAMSQEVHIHHKLIFWSSIELNLLVHSVLLLQQLSWDANFSF